MVQASISLCLMVWAGLVPQISWVGLVLKFLYRKTRFGSYFSMKLDQSGPCSPVTGKFEVIGWVGGSL